MKTEKFTIEVENLKLEVIATMEIGKQEFRRQLKFLRERTNETACETQTEELPMKATETECYFLYEYTFLRGCCFTTLSHRKCKDGYRFKSQSEK